MTHFPYVGDELIGEQCLVIVCFENDVPVQQVCEDLNKAYRLANEIAYADWRGADIAIAYFIYEADGVCRRYVFRDVNNKKRVEVDLTPTVTSVWPPTPWHCAHKNSCAKHGQCMYFPCVHNVVQIKDKP